jgi:hypothetical protein
MLNGLEKYFDKICDWGPFHTLAANMETGEYSVIDNESRKIIYNGFLW